MFKGPPGFWRRHRSSKLFLWAIAVFFILELFIMPRRVVPPAHVKSFDDYIDWRPAPLYIVLFQRGSDTLLAVAGSSDSPVPSGPAMYIFDASGQMIDWTGDSGDSDLPERYQIRKNTIRGLTVSGAHDWFSQQVLSKPADLP
jgi:hypothetical protein